MTPEVGEHRSEGVFEVVENEHSVDECVREEDGVQQLSEHVPAVPVDQFVTVHHGLHEVRQVEDAHAREQAHEDGSHARLKVDGK